MAKRRRRKFETTEFSWELLEGTFEGDKRSFNLLKRHLRYDEKGNDVLTAYLNKESQRLKRLPDSEFGDLMAEADKQIWRCSEAFLTYRAVGKKQKLRFKVYFYQRLKQCMMDRRKKTVSGKDLGNTQAYSLNEMMEETGFDAKDNSINQNPEVTAAVRKRLDSLDKRERLVANRIMEGWTLADIKRDLQERLLNSKQGRNPDKIRKFVDRTIRNSMEMMKDMFGDLVNV